MNVSIIMAVYNDKSYIKGALDSIFAQTHKDFEFIIINDCSTDGTIDIINKYKDKRMKVYKNPSNMGIAKSRNRAIGLAKGKYIFFTDSDCVADKDWLKEGLKAFKGNLAVEGTTYYISKDYKYTVSDKLPGALATKGEYMTCNMAYRKEVFDKYGSFDQRYKYHEDRELALRTLKHGSIAYSNKMIIIHQKKSWDFTSMMKSATRVSDRIHLFNDHNVRAYMIGRIMHPSNLLKILIPPLILFPILRGQVKSWLDFKVMIANYPRVIYERYLIWKTAISEKTFVI